MSWMMWVIIVQFIVILFLAWLIKDSQKALRMMADMWAEEQNRKWLEMMKETGSKMVIIKEEQQ